MRREIGEVPILKNMIAFSVRAPLGSDVHREVKKNVENIIGGDGFVHIVDRRELPEREIMITGFAFQGVRIIDGKIEP